MPFVSEFTLNVEPLQSYFMRLR